MKSCTLLLAMLTTLALGSCELIDIAQDPDRASGTVYYWISTDADTYVECIGVVGPCQSFDVDRSGSDGLVVAHTASVIKRTYVNFPKPAFPPGTKIEEAYFELYHSGKNEDGKTDNIQLSVTRVRNAWSAGQLRYVNQPVPVESGGEFRMRLESQAWSGTQNIGFDMNQDLIDGSTLEGFVVFISPFEPGYEKGFYSGNHTSRTLGDLGFAPRLLLKVTLPEGMSTDDVTFPGLHTDGSAGSFFGIEFRNSSNWPADWDIAIQD